MRIDADNNRNHDSRDFPEGIPSQKSRLFQIRIESGIQEKQLEAATVKEVLDALAQDGISEKKLRGCVILVNGNSANKRSKLKDGDTVVLMSPVAGG